MMEYVLYNNESLPDGIRRIVYEQIDNATAHLRDEIEGDFAQHIHEVRKRFKQIRAVLRLIRGEIGDDIYRFENDFYRDLGKRLAPLREQFVLIEALDKMLNQTDRQDVAHDAKYIRATFTERYEQTYAELQGSSSTITDQVIEALTVGRERVATWPLKRDKFKAIKRGLKRIYSKGQTRMAYAYDHPLSAEAFHEWRKLVKYLWYHARLLREINPIALNPLIEELDLLADLLGDAHDLAELYEVIKTHPDTRHGGGRYLLAMIDYQRATLERQAQPIGERSYQSSAKKFAKTIKADWKAWHKQADARQTSEV